jgi:hypothetical protein
VLTSFLTFSLRASRRSGWRSKDMSLSWWLPSRFERCRAGWFS